VTAAQAPAGATADLQRRWNEADQERRAAKRDLADARRRAQRAAQIQDELAAQARRLGLELVITHGHSPDGGTDR
jgi:hypothetical protein